MLFLAVAAHAQSPALIEAVRVHRPAALATAQAELSACAAPCAEGATLSLLAGHLMLSSGDPSGAVQQLTSRPAPKGLEAFYGWYLGEAQAWAGKRAAALKTFKAVKAPPQWLKKKLAVRTAELLLAQGDAKKALPLFEAAAAEDSAELLYQRGLARLLGGQADKGRADLKAVMVRFPAHPHAALAQAQLDWAKKPAVFSNDDRFARQAGFLAAGDPKAAGAELDAIALPEGKKSEALRASAAIARAGVLFALQLEKEANEQIDAAMAGPPWAVASAMMMRARKLLRASDNTAARELMLSIDQKYPTESPADEAGYLAGWIAMQAGDYAAGVKDFASFEERHPESRKRDEARWFRAYCLIRQDKFAEARSTIASLTADFPRTSLVAQAKYWSARCGQLVLGKPDAGLSPTAIAGEYRELIASSPGSFYALLAQQRLRDLGETAPPTFADGAKPAEGGAAPAELKLALALAKAGLLRDAWEETQARIAQIGSADALRFGQALQGLGEFGGAHALAARHLWAAVYTQRSPEAVALMYPRAYRESVERLSKERGLDPFLAWAIMRRESAFKPEVFSSADARGLMQLIPPTARAIARALKLEEPQPDELYSPEANIMLGTWYLAALMDRFRHPTLCAAAYNAGPNPVAKWATQRNGLSLDLWVEEIPYKETRAYVKQVTADYFIYRGLYGEKTDPVLPLALQVPVPRDGGVSF